MNIFKKNKPFYQAFIFDMDGTIVSTIEDICDAVNHSLKKNGFPLISYEECTSYLGNGSVKLIQRAMHHQSEEHFQKVFDDYYHYYLNHFVVKTKPYEGLIDVLTFAKERGILLFIYTNKPEKIALEIERSLFPQGMFSRLVGIPLGGKTKPDPEAFIKACEEYHLDYSRCAYFGDSRTDILTAKNLNVHTTCSVLWGYEKEASLRQFEVQPDCYLYHTKEIISFIERDIVEI